MAAPRRNIAGNGKDFFSGTFRIPRASLHFSPFARRSLQSANKLSPSRRGYGRSHRALRSRLQRVVDAGEAVCWRCGEPIEPGSPWDLGHDPLDRSVYRGPEHVGCNRATNQKRKTSRRW